MNDIVLVLCPEDQKSRDGIVAAIRKCGLHPESCSSYKEARGALVRHELAAVFCTDALDDADYLQVIETAKPVPVIVVSRFADWGPYVAALRAGAFDYVASPPASDEVERILRCALEEDWRLARVAATA